MTSLLTRALAEALGTLLLLACVVGSGVMGVALSQGNDGVALLANAAATAGILYVLIVGMGPVSGGHCKPAVSLVVHLRGRRSPAAFAAYVGAQLVGAVAGVVLAHAMFGLDLVQAGTHARTGPSQWLSEGVATFGLLLTIGLGVKRRPAAVPALVACYIFAAYWFTASTSFANPAVTVARSLTTSFAGIRPLDVGGFVAVQLVGALLAMPVVRLLGRDNASG